MSQGDHYYKIVCPWCQEEQKIEEMPDNMIMAFNCQMCSEPIVVIQGIPVKIDKDVLESGDIMLLQEHILDILEREFDIPTEGTELDLIESSFQEGAEQDEEEGEISLRPKKIAPIDDIDILKMKEFLKNFKIPRDGRMFE